MPVAAYLIIQIISITLVKIQSVHSIQWKKKITVRIMTERTQKLTNRIVIKKRMNYQIKSGKVLL